MKKKNYGMQEKPRDNYVPVLVVYIEKRSKPLEA